MDAEVRRYEGTCDGVLDAIGNTPLIQLRRFLAPGQTQVFVKYEAANPGGSAKDRPAARMLRAAMHGGQLRAGGTVIESSSGNMAIGLAQACAYLDLHLICVIDPKTSPQTVAILHALGARTDLVEEPDAASGEFQPARIARVKKLLQGIENAYWPNQYANRNNAVAHRQTMAEITAILGKQIDYLLCPVSTCGTLRGCAEYAAERHLRTRVIAVDACGSVIFGGKKEKRLLPGHGGALKPGLAESLACDGVVYVSDSDCVAACRRLALTEGLLVGASAGGALMALARMESTFTPGSTCVVIAHDRGERYLHSVYCDAWVQDRLGDIPDFEILRRKDADIRQLPSHC